MEKSNRKNTLWIGIDVSKQTFDAGIHYPVERAMKLSEIKVHNFDRTEKGVSLLIEWIQKEKEEFKGKEGITEELNFRVAMEVTGRYSIELAAWLSLQSPECKPAIVDAKAMKNYGKSLKVRNKNDKIDAAVITHFAYERQPDPYTPPAPEYQKLKELVRHRKRLVNLRMQARQEASEVLEIKEIKRSFKAILKSMDKEIKKIELEISKHIKCNKNLACAVELLISIPGVGEITAATVLGELGDLTRFANSKQLTAFAGVSPRQNESGTSLKGKTRMCKEGNRNVRPILYLTALSAATRGKKNSFSIFYERLLANGKCKKVALGAIMRKILVVMRALLVNKQEYFFQCGSHC